MADIAEQAWEIVFRYHRILLSFSEHGRDRDKGEVSVRLEEAINNLLRGEGLSEFILSKRPTLIMYAIKHFLPHARAAEIMTHLVRRCGTMVSPL